MSDLRDLPEAEHVAKAQVAWLRDLMILIGPRKVQEGVRFLRLAEFIDEGLAEIERLVRRERSPMDDDIPF